MSLTVNDITNAIFKSDADLTLVSMTGDLKNNIFNTNNLVNYLVNGNVNLTQNNTGTINVNNNYFEVTGPTGPIGSLPVNGTETGNYIFWNEETNDWEVGKTKIKLGSNAGLNQQSNNSIAIGTDAGKSDQDQYSIAIGFQAGYTGQSEYTIAIGNKAGYLDQPTNSIVLNASSQTLNNSSSGFFVNPLRENTSQNMLYYDTNSKEISYSAKTFIIDHPVESEKYLIHACLEGPEEGVYYRGKSEILQNSEFIEIKLPNYVSNLAKDFSVQLTPIFSIDKDMNRQLQSTDVEDSKFKVYGKSGKFFWHVYGKRNDIVTEPNKNDVCVKGDGPYKWI